MHAASSKSVRTVVSGLGAMLLLGGALTALGGTTLSADAATPAGGSISAAHPGVGWSGGPFAAPNATGNVLDAPDCSAPDSCDDFALHVDTPSGYGKDHQLKVSVRWADAAADFDLYLLDGKGDTVATAASSSDPELILAAPKAGTYTVRVVPYAPLGDSYRATAKLVDRPADPAPGTQRPPDVQELPRASTPAGPRQRR